MCQYSYFYKGKTNKNEEYYMVRLADGLPLIFSDEEVSTAYKRATKCPELQIPEDDFKPRRSYTLTFLIALVIGFIIGLLI